MGKYDRDPRVRKEGKGYTVTAHGTRYRVLPTDAFGWGIFTGPNLNMVLDEHDRLATGYNDADAAIRALIGRR